MNTRTSKTLKRLSRAAVLELIGSVLLVLFMAAVVFAFAQAAQKAVDSGSAASFNEFYDLLSRDSGAAGEFFSEGTFVFLLVGMAFMLVGFVLLAVSLVIELVGLIGGRNINGSFNRALWWPIIIALVYVGVGAVSAFLRWKAPAYSNSLSILLTAVLMLFVLRGTNEELIRAGKSLAVGLRTAEWVIIGTFLVSAVCTLFSGRGTGGVSLAAAVISAAAHVAGSLVYIKCTSRAAKELAD